MNLSDDRVQYIFDQMGVGYDEMRDLWYSWLFCRVHFFIVRDILCHWDNRPRKVLDAGCGTGLQSFLYASTGADVQGIDISPGLIAVAENKKSHPPKVANLFEPHFKFVEVYNDKIERLRKSCFNDAIPELPNFTVQSMLDLEFSDCVFDHVNCCGSVLSFIQDHETAIREISRVLKPGGTFILEVDAKYNLDLLWGLFDSLTGGSLGYEMSVREALSPLMTRPSDYASVEYPFGETDNPVYMPIKLFTRKGLANDLFKQNLVVKDWKSIHSITNFLPSTILDSAKPSDFVRRLFSFFSTLEETIPWNLPSCSIVAIGSKLD
jgi:ubiquinone/menaquinone biosynthesis C-methylase UbiE